MLKPRQRRLDPLTKAIVLYPKGMVDTKVEIITGLVAALIMLVALGFSLYGLEQNNLALPIVASGIIVFFGILIISGYNKTSTDKKASKTKGIMRRAIAGALIISYIMAFSMLMFSDYQKEQAMPSIEEIKKMNQTDVDKFLQIQNQTAAINNEKMKFSDSVLSNFTNVIMIVIAFYFGTKAVLQYIKDKNPSFGDDELGALINKAEESVKKAKENQTEKKMAFDEANAAFNADSSNNELKDKKEKAEAALTEAKSVVTKKEKELKDTKKKLDDTKKALGAI